MIKINNIKIPINSDIPIEEKIKKVLKNEGFSDLKIIKQSVDARKRNDIYFVYSVAVTCKNEKKLVNRLADRNVAYIEPKQPQRLICGSEKLFHRPIVIGTGPGGLFCAYTLAKYGFRPLVFERGEDVDGRIKSVESFWNGGKLNTSSNVQFGEGGAGTFSDGKLTTRINDPHCDTVLNTFAENGAPKDILFEAKPHIGTDILRSVVKNMRNEIIRLGGEVLFNHTLTGIEFDGRMRSIIANGTEYPCEVLVLAIGHSARDTFEMLLGKGVAMQAKSFSMGVRAEHLQSEIDKSMYGDFAGSEKLPPASYQLWNKSADRCCYSFCMCPGGSVVASASEENTVVTNGMSLHSRNEKNANSALVVDVHPNDFDGILGGMYFQRELERKAFVFGGKNYFAPSQSIGSFLYNENTAHIEPSYRPGTTECDFAELLPSFISENLKTGILAFERKIKGFSAKSAVLTGVETRTSSPVRILRNEELEAIGISGLYPCGEGAGYAGGIVSAAVDGIKIAEKIISKYIF